MPRMNRPTSPGIPRMPLRRPNMPGIMPRPPMGVGGGRPPMIQGMRQGGGGQGQGMGNISSVTIKFEPKNNPQKPVR